MEKVFVYGTLNDPVVQKQVIGRAAPLVDDELPGFKKEKIQINGIRYPIAVPNGSEHIKGKVLEVSKKELLLLDKYETAAYRRVEVTLKSGISAWLYCMP